MRIQLRHLSDIKILCLFVLFGLSGWIIFTQEPLSSNPKLDLPKQNDSKNAEVQIHASSLTRCEINTSTISKQATLSGHKHHINAVSFSPNSQHIATASSDGTVRIWNLTGKQLVYFKPGAQVYAANFSPDGQRIVTANRGRQGALWDFYGNRLATLKGHQRSVNGANFSSDGVYVLTTSADNTARIWRISNRQVVVLRGHQDAVINAGFNQDGKYIITASFDKTSRIWDLSGRQLAVLRGHQNRINTASFSPDGQKIITASDDNTARLWNLSGRMLLSLKHEGWVSTAKFSRDGQKILTASHDMTARIWSISGQPLAVLKGHEDGVYDATFSPNGKCIVTSSGDNTVRIWNITGKEVAKIEGFYKGFLSPDGKWLVTVTSSPNYLAVIWKVKSNEQVAAAPPNSVTQHRFPRNRHGRSDGQFCSNLRRPRPSASAQCPSVIYPRFSLAPVASSNPEQPAAPTQGGDSAKPSLGHCQAGSVDAGPSRPVGRDAIGHEFAQSSQQYC
jgi:WD40 repeat protein